MGMMLKNLVHPYIESTTVLCDRAEQEWDVLDIEYSCLSLCVPSHPCLYNACTEAYVLVSGIG